MVYSINATFDDTNFVHNQPVIADVQVEPVVGMLPIPQGSASLPAITAEPPIPEGAAMLEGAGGASPLSAGDSPHASAGLPSPYASPGSPYASISTNPDIFETDPLQLGQLPAWPDFFGFDDPNTHPFFYNGTEPQPRPRPSYTCQANKFRADSASGIFL